MKARTALAMMGVAAIAATAMRPAAADTLSAASYEHDGLVGQWDGIENAGANLHVANTNYWTDLTGQTGDFAVFSGVASFTANGLKKDAKGIMATNVTPTARSDVRTIEIVISDIPASGWVNAFYARGQTVTFRNSNGGSSYRDYFFDNNHLGCSTLQKPAQETIAVTYSSASTANNYYQNGVKPDGANYPNFWNAPPSSAIHIGGRTGSSYASSGDATTYGYTIHAIRLYARVLTSAEISRHATIDQIRFFGASPEVFSADTDKFAVMATADVGGLVSVDDVNALPAGTAKFELGIGKTVSIALRATPLPGWKFAGWEGDISDTIEGSSATPTFVVMAACGRCDYRATFERDLDNPEIPYVTNGLVGRWDGLENAGVGVNDMSAARWVDLSGNAGDFIVLTNTASFTGAGLKKNAAGVCATNLAVHTGVQTIEAAVSGVPSSGWVNAVFLGKYQTVAFRNESGNKRQFFFDNDNLKWNMEGQPNALMVSAIYDLSGSNPQGQSFYLDGFSPQSGSIYGTGMYWHGSSQVNTSIGGRMAYLSDGDANTKGYTVHALRFYNRALTAGEIAYNGAVDRLRFRGLRREAFAYRLADGNVQCQLRAWMDGTGGTIKLNNGEATTNSVATAWGAFGTAQTATFTAAPRAGWTFVGWTGDVDDIVSGTANDLTVSVNATHGVALQAQFTTTGKYVQDGLIGFWDALENAGFGHHDPNAAAWTDLTGVSGDFLVNTASGVFETNALYKVRKGRLAFNSKRRADIRTVEAVVSCIPANIWTMPIFVRSGQNITLKDPSGGEDRLYFFDYNNFGWTTSEHPDQMTIAVLYESTSAAEDFFVNGAKPEGNSYSNYWGDFSGIMSMGGRTNTGGEDSLSIGYRIHAVRFYNRQLTENEIKRNARQDAIRFFGQPVPGVTIIIR